MAQVLGRAYPLDSPDALRFSFRRHQIKSLSLLCAIAAVASSAPATLLAQEAAQPAPEVRARPLTFEVRSQAPDDELLEVARAADVALFVDATDLPKEASAFETEFPNQKQWYLENLFNELGPSRHLAWEIRQDDRAVVAGPEPDLKAVRLALLAGGGVDVAAPKMDQATFNARLTDYLQREKGWKGAGTELNTTIALADLPPDLKYEMMVRAQQGALHESLGGASMLRKLIAEETWQSARISIGVDQGKSFLGLIFKTPTSDIGQQLTPLPQAAPRQR